MKNRRVGRLAALAATAIVVASCGGSDNNTPAPAAVGDYLSALPKWEQFSPPVAEQPPKKVEEPGNPATTNERIDTQTAGGITSVQYACTTTKMTMSSTPDKIVMFSPDREILWPGALLQGKSHRDGVGSLLPLPIRDRMPIKVSIPSLASNDNFRVVELPDQANVNQAIGNLVANATTNNLVAPSSIQFTMSDYTSSESFALKAKMSGKYLGFSGSASGSVSNKANEQTVMVYFLEKMFEVVVEPPATPGAFFNTDFTREKLDEQIALGRIGTGNLPVYVSNIVYGRMMAFTFTSTASTTEIEAALNASYKGIFDADFEVESQYSDTFKNARITVTSLGGSSSATVAMIASGDWRQYFQQGVPLTAAYPLSYTFRNLGDGSIAKVAEATEYNVKECVPNNTAGFMLDSFESPTATTWDDDNDGTAIVPLQVTIENEASPLSLFYGFEKARHTNFVDPSSNRFMYDVGYVKSPTHATGALNAYYRGELSFWHRPDDTLYWDGSPRRVCYIDIIWVLFVPIPIERCYWLPSPFTGAQKLTVEDHTVFTYDDSTTADQIVLRGGSATNAYERLTLTYNPKNAVLPLEWKKYVVSLSNDDSAGQSLCEKREIRDPTTNELKRIVYYGCWLVEDRPATEFEIQYVLGYVNELKLRASNAVHETREVCVDDPCTAKETRDVLIGYVGSYFDEIKLTKPMAGF